MWLGSGGCCSSLSYPPPHCSDSDTDQALGSQGKRTLVLPKSPCCHWPLACSELLSLLQKSCGMFPREGSPNGLQLCKCSRSQWAKMLFSLSISEPRPGKINNSPLHLCVLIFSTFSAVFLLSQLLFCCNVRKVTYQKCSDWSVDLSSQHFSWILFSGAVCCACKQLGVFQIKDLCVNNMYETVVMCPFKGQLNTWIDRKAYWSWRAKKRGKMLQILYPLSFLPFTCVPGIHLLTPPLFSDSWSVAFLLLVFYCYSWPCMSVSLIHCVGDAGRSCFSAKSKAMLYCFFLRRWWGQAASLCLPGMLSFAAQSHHFHFSLLV